MARRRKRTKTEILGDVLSGAASTYIPLWKFQQQQKLAQQTLAQQRALQQAQMGYYDAQTRELDAKSQFFERIWNRAQERAGTGYTSECPPPPPGTPQSLVDAWGCDWTASESQYPRFGDISVFAQEGASPFPSAGVQRRESPPQAAIEGVRQEFPTVIPSPPSLTRTLPVQGPSPSAPSPVIGQTGASPPFPMVTRTPSGGLEGGVEAPLTPPMFSTGVEQKVFSDKPWTVAETEEDSADPRLLARIQFALNQPPSEPVQDFPPDLPYRIAFGFAGLNPTATMGAPWSSPQGRRAVEDAIASGKFNRAPREQAVNEYIGNVQPTTVNFMDLSTGKNLVAVMSQPALMRAARDQVARLNPETNQWEVTSPGGLAAHGAMVFPAPAPAGAQGKIAEYSTALSLLGDLRPDIEDLIKRAEGQLRLDEGQVGPGMGRLSTFRQYLPGPLGLDDPLWNRYTAKSAMLKNSVIKAITGAQMGEAEATRLMEQIPLPTDPLGVLLAKYDATVSNLQAASMAQRMMIPLEEVYIRRIMTRPRDPLGAGAAAGQQDAWLNEEGR
jgi:hypothetical protein